MSRGSRKSERIPDKLRKRMKNGRIDRGWKEFDGILRFRLEKLAQISLDTQ